MGDVVVVGKVKRGTALVSINEAKGGWLGSYIPKPGGTQQTFAQRRKTLPIPAASPRGALAGTIGGRRQTFTVS